MSPNPIYDAYFASFAIDQLSFTHFELPSEESTVSSSEFQEHPSFLFAPEVHENSSTEAVDAILRASSALSTEDSTGRFIADEECTQNGMESKAILEQLSELMYEDRHEVERLLRSSLPPKSTISSIDRVAKWIVRNEIENTEGKMESAFDAAIFKFDIFKRWVEEDEENESEISH
ncbi:hypothetical protein PRIPAC_76172 [Pristionchus pacificus]|uniref:Uncharacterized protein n=1 Tax=Pristionchus pacificus TaxID=54126 RepID=A0A2A6C8N8_PRIPA|nr:hypothetical protein PRIPAC_76172 [Pristionchus pacificus]|eukprot:PDM74477.1 hypothetical protein PRIPAC_41833 [Pristionchus pacificus]